LDEQRSSGQRNHLWTTYTLRRKDGEPFVIKGNHLENFNGFDATLRRELLRWRLPVLLALYRTGSTLTFGKLQVSQEGITVGANTLPWEEVEEVEVTDERISVLRKGSHRCWAKVQVAGLPNALLFPALAQELSFPGAPVRAAR
jgi:hypothetical protein